MYIVSFAARVARTDPDGLPTSAFLIAWGSRPPRVSPLLGPRTRAMPERQASFFLPAISGMRGWAKAHHIHQGPGYWILPVTRDTSKENMGVDVYMCMYVPSR